MIYLWRTMPLEICMLGYAISMFVAVLVYFRRKK